MNNLTKFLNWGIKNGYGDVQIPQKTLKIFVHYLDDHDSKVKKLNIPAVSGRSEQLCVCCGKRKRYILDKCISCHNGFKDG